MLCTTEVFSTGVAVGETTCFPPKESKMQNPFFLTELCEVPASNLSTSEPRQLTRMPQIPLASSVFKYSYSCPDPSLLLLLF